MSRLRVLVFLTRGLAFAQIQADDHARWHEGDQFYEQTTAFYLQNHYKDDATRIPWAAHTYLTAWQAAQFSDLQCPRRPCVYERGLLFLTHSDDNLGMAPAQSTQECCQACYRTPRCRFFSYHKGKCSLKASNQQWRTGTPYESGVVSGACACEMSVGCSLTPESCHAGTYLDEDICSCRTCTACQPGHYAAIECSSDHDSHCSPCSECAPGQFELKKCSASRDTVCHVLELKGDYDLYDVLGVPKDASQTEIRLKYKVLTQTLHPDKNPDPRAAQMFAEVSAAYAILGDPDKRSTYDDFGEDNLEGFNTFWEYQQSSSRATKDFYTGEKLITRLTHKNWEQRVTHGFWFVKFYAPWCTHCISGSQTFKEMARELEGEVEFGAVNCVNEPDLQNKFGLTAFPSFFLVAPELGFQLQYNWNGPEGMTNNLPTWARELTKEWQLLADRSRIVKLSPEKFQTDVLNSTDVWVVLFINGASCVKCNEAQSNFYRFGSDVSGVARVGVADCMNVHVRHVCDEHGVPGHNYPHFWLYSAGPDKGKGQQLFNANEMPVHVALPAVAKVLRASLTHYLVKEGELLVKPDEDGDYEDTSEKKKETPPPPPPSYDQPPPRQHFHQVEGNSRPSHRALPQG